MHSWTQIIASIVALVCAASLSVHALPIDGPSELASLANTEVVDTSVVDDTGVAAFADDIPTTPLNDRQLGEDSDGSLSHPEVGSILTLALRDEVDIFGLVGAVLDLTEEETDQGI
ncbi:hypothetical protein BKA70DRAFT_1223213 [Coprinopsis sp. MPI-PUGE-AT-0042]|nr:hypothetical protein BKA70DRAFT_1223213 [Coprinopsis sp. MPI-PUGE-AT-0042]